MLIIELLYPHDKITIKYKSFRIIIGINNCYLVYFGKDNMPKGLCDYLRCSVVLIFLFNLYYEYHKGLEWRA